MDGQFTGVDKTDAGSTYLRTLPTLMRTGAHSSREYSSRYMEHLRTYYLHLPTLFSASIRDDEEAEIYYVLLSIVAAADTFYTACTAELTVDSGWVDGCIFGVGANGWLCWSTQKLK